MPFLLTAAAAFFVNVSSSAATAHAQCAPQEIFLEGLLEKFNEAPIAAGVTSTGSLVEVLTSGKGETWTIIVTSPQGTSCLVAAGDGWQMKDHKPEGPTR